MSFLCCKVKLDQFIKRVLRNKSKHAKKDFTHGLNRGAVKFCLRLKLFQAVLNILKCLAHLMNYTVVVTVRILGSRRYKEQHQTKNFCQTIELRNLTQNLVWSCLGSDKKRLIANGLSQFALNLVQPWFSPCLVKVQTK